MARMTRLTSSSSPEPDADSDINAASRHAESPRGKSTAKVPRRTSAGGRAKNVAGRMSSMLEDEASAKQSRILKQLDTGTKGVLDEIDLDADGSYPRARPAKRAKTSGKAPLQQIAVLSEAPQKTSDGKKVKKWLTEGLYVGQEADSRSSRGGAKQSQLKRPSSSSSDSMPNGSVTTPASSFLPLPMFGYLDNIRDFFIPFDIFAPSFKKGDEKPKDWQKLNRNRLVGEAKEIWEGTLEKLASSMCVCEPPAVEGQGCEDDCLNRVMQYECNDDNCNLSATQCSNRAFAELAARVKKGGRYDIGVEVIKTAQRGFGVRSCRAFAPGQIIMEYTGEIISEGECQRRMREEYKGKQCYYLMELERGLLIDGTRGSVARFVNHSCAPNCEVRMVKVKNTPRMAVFAGEDGISTGEELTYDYNFDNFGTSRQVCYCGASTCRGFLSKRLNAVEQKRLLKEQAEKKRKAAEEAQKHAEAEAKKKQVKADRGSSWRGWVAVDDPETKVQLKKEKKEREEAEKNSDRARRLAARRTSLPSKRAAPEPMEKEPKPKRRRTVHGERGIRQEWADEAADEVADSEDETAENERATRSGKKRTNVQALYPGLKYEEELTRPRSARSASKSARKTRISTITTTPEARRRGTRRFLLGDDDDDDDDETPPAADAEDDAATQTLLSVLSRTASKGNEMLKSVVQMSGKLRQSTLNFPRRSSSS